MRHVLSFDIEDNFERSELVKQNDFSRFEGQVVENTKRITRLLEASGTKAVFFVVGEVAERRPELLETIIDGGHQLGCHGYLHRPVRSFGEMAFEQDAAKGKIVLEQLSGLPVTCFRAMAFSVTPATPWFYSSLRSAGYRQSSSVLKTAFCASLRTAAIESSIQEIPVTSVRIRGRALPVGGGFAFRLAPTLLLGRLIAREQLANSRFVIYCHAWEFNRSQPARNVSLPQRLAQHPVTFSTPRKVKNLIRRFDFGPLVEAVRPSEQSK